MIILEPDNTPSPLKKDMDIPTSSTAPVATAPPPYTPIQQTPLPNPRPAYQAIPLPGPQPVSSPSELAFRRFIRAFVVAVLVLLLWGAFVDSVNKVFRHPSRGHYEIGMSHRGPTCEDYPCHSLEFQPGIDDTGRILPIQYPPIQPLQTTG